MTCTIHASEILEAAFCISTSAGAATQKPSLLFELTLNKLFAADVLFQHGSLLL